MKYIIDRSKWVFGCYPKLLGDSCLLNSMGKMCCLGQVIAQDGIKPDCMLNHGEPIDLINVLPDAHWTLTGSKNSVISWHMMNLNDSHSPDLLNRDRERSLKVLAQKAGHEFEFVGEYPAGTEDKVL